MGCGGTAPTPKGAGRTAATSSTPPAAVSYSGKGIRHRPVPPGWYLEWHGRIQGGGGVLAFGGPPNFIKREKNVARAAKTPHFSTKQLPGPPPPLSEILYPPLNGFVFFNFSQFRLMAYDQDYHLFSFNEKYYILICSVL